MQDWLCSPGLCSISGLWASDSLGVNIGISQEAPTQLHFVLPQSVWKLMQWTLKCE